MYVSREIKKNYFVLKKVTCVCLFINIILLLQKSVANSHSIISVRSKNLLSRIDFGMFASSATMNTTSRNRDFASMLTNIVLNEETR